MFLELTRARGTSCLVVFVVGVFACDRGSRSRDLLDGSAADAADASSRNAPVAPGTGDADAEADAASVGDGGPITGSGGAIALGDAGGGAGAGGSTDEAKDGSGGGGTAGVAGTGGAPDNGGAAGTGGTAVARVRRAPPAVQRARGESRARRPWMYKLSRGCDG